jgi:hypothetical protein
LIHILVVVNVSSFLKRKKMTKRIVRSEISDTIRNCIVTSSWNGWCWTGT